MTRGTIHSLIHLCSAADFPSTHLVNGHNGVGYGYINGPEGDVFFDDLGVTNSRFDALRKDMVVEYVLEKASHERASSVTVVDDQENAARHTLKAIVLPGEDVVEAFDESSMESFPASDSPARSSQVASGS